MSWTHLLDNSLSFVKLSHRNHGRQQIARHFKVHWLHFCSTAKELDRSAVIAYQAPEPRRCMHGETCIRREAVPVLVGCVVLSVTAGVDKRTRPLPVPR